MSLSDLEKEMALHKHFVNDPDGWIGYLRSDPVAPPIQILATFGMERGWLWPDVTYSANWHMLECRWRLTAAGRERLFNRPQ